MKSFLHDKNVAVTNGKNFTLDKFKTDYKGGLDKKKGKELFIQIREEIAELQDKLYAQNKNGLLIVFQAMDAAGKDGTIKSVMSGINPQGCNVVSFKKPSQLELEHDFLWRCYKELPERGHIGIFNRSYYEEVLVTRVHPGFIVAQNLPEIRTEKDIKNSFWEQRFEAIRNFEKHLYQSGTVILKFFLNVSKKEQKARFLERISEPEKNWKFSYSDLAERKYWDSYQNVYEDAIKNTATDWAPWFVVPADSNWSRNLIVSAIILDKLKEMELSYPTVSSENVALLQKGKKELLAEKD